MTAKNHLTKLLGFALTLFPAAASAGTASVYVTNSAGDSIHVIDTATNKVTQEIKGIGAAHGICFAPDGSRIYVSDEEGNTLDVLDRKTGEIIKKVPLSNHPNNIAITKNGDRVIVGIRKAPGALDVIDTATLTLKKSIPVHGGLHNVYVTPDGKYAVTGSIPAKTLTVIDLQTEQPAWELKFDLGIRPMAIEADADGATKRIFVQLSDFNGFAVVDFAQRKEVARITLPDSPTGYGIEERRGDAPSHGIGVSPDRSTLWVTSIYANAVFAYSLADMKLLGHVSLPDLKLPGRSPIGAVPNWVTFSPDGNNLYISNAALKSVSVVDTKGMKLIGALPVGEVPKRINTLALQ